MNRLIVGDIHSKARTILLHINEVVEKYNVDEVYFLGDYVDDWGIENSERMRDLNVLIAWNKESKTKNTFLCGNHDLAYIAPIFHCSGHSTSLEKELSQLLIKDLNVQLAATVNNYVLTHAGITEQWLSYMNKYNYMIIPHNVTREQLVTQLNTEFDKIKNQVLSKGPVYCTYKTNPIVGITACGYRRGGFSECSGPLWCDKEELEIYATPRFDQIVGHTPVATCMQEIFEYGDIQYTVWFCDTQSTYRNLSPIGDKSLLLLTDKKGTLV